MIPEHSTSEPIMRRDRQHGRKGPEYVMVAERYWALHVQTTSGDCWRIYADTRLSKALSAMANRFDFIGHMGHVEISRSQYQALKAKLETMPKTQVRKAVNNQFAKD